MSRLFVAAWPDAGARTVLSTLDRRQVDVRWVDPERWHVTLTFLGEADEAMAGESLAALVAEATTVDLGPAVAMLGDRVVMVPARGLEALAAATSDQFVGVGSHGSDRPFSGHLTLGRLRRVGPVELVGRPCRASWPVDTIALVRSEPVDGGARYRVIATRELVQSS